jgi:uncharacterized protein (TIGR02599 family)
MRNEGTFRGRNREKAFSLIEVLVSSAVIALLAGLLLGVVSHTQRSWGYAKGRLEEFKEASRAFDIMSRSLSESTLNVRMEYDDPTNPTALVRRSDLRFLSGPNSRLFPGSAAASLPGMSVFFQSPSGFSTNATNGLLRNTVATRGYFLEYGPDTAVKPAFLDASIQSRGNRYRLMELKEPTESLSVLAHGAGNSGYTNTDWVTDSLLQPVTRRPAHVLAENVVGMILLPKLPDAQLSAPYTASSLAPDYVYDSSRTNPRSSDPILNPHHQLPPVLQVTLIAVDEASALKFPAALSSLSNAMSGLFSDSRAYSNDLAALESYLVTRGISYRVFSTEVPIRGAKWSMSQTN